MIFNKELLIEKAEFIIGEAEKLKTSQTEVTIIKTNSALTRLANSIIDQNVTENHVNIIIIVYIGKRKGSIRVETFDNDLLKELVNKAVKIAKITPENKHFESLPKPKPYSDKLGELELVSPKTIETTPEQRAEYAKLVINTAHDMDKCISSVSGAISNKTEEKVVKNSLGVEAYDARTVSNINLTILGNKNGEEAAGWSSDSRRDITKLKITEVAQKASQKVIDGFGAEIIEPGEYEVVLEPAAVQGLVSNMNFYGFNALMYQEYRSFLRDKIGKKIFSEKLNIWSDPLDNRGLLASTFDDEGYPTKRLELITKGIVKSLVYDTLTASKDGVKSTGHNIKPSGVSFMGDSFPVPNHLFVKDGNSNIEEMISETKNGILVTHFHYENAVNPVKGVFTGLTRDGTWLIKNGEIKAPLKTLRYTDSVINYFKDIDLIGTYQELRDGYSHIFQGIYPPMKLPSFNFTGSVEK